MANRNHDPKELKAAAEHVKYEIRMLRYAASRVRGEDSPLKNIAVEAFLLHYRNLRAFFCPSLQRTCGGDVVASDYLEKLIAEDVGDASVLGFDKERLNRSLAHISYDRLKYDSADKSWPVNNMIADVERSLVVFRNALPQERRAWFPEPETPTALGSAVTTR